MRQILEKCLEQNIDEHLPFNDFQAAYGTVRRKEIRSEMHNAGFPPKSVKLCRILNNEIYTKVKNSKYPLNLTLTKF